MIKEKIYRDEQQRRFLKSETTATINQRIQNLDLISLVQRRLREQLIEGLLTRMNLQLPVLEGSSIMTLNGRTRNKGAKRIIKHFSTSVAQHFYSIKITTTWNALPSEVVTAEQ